MPTTRKRKTTTTKKKVDRKKLQYFIDSVGGKRSITIFIKGGIVQDIVNTSCPEISVIVHDYDMKKDIDNEQNFHVDKYGEEYFKIILN
jgi:hypothetical protein